MASYFTIDATAGTATANSYIASATEAKTIANVLRTMPGFGLDFSAFDALTDDQLTDLAVTAAAGIDQMPFPGFKKTSSQAMQWPRVATRNPRLENTIPDGMKFGQVAEMATLASAATEAQTAADAGVAAFTVGKKSVTYDTNRMATDRGRRISESARRVMVHFGIAAGTVGNAYLSRG